MSRSRDVQATIKERYRRFGGLSAYAERLRRGESNLKEAADAGGVSKETIRNDLKRLIGADGLKALMVERRKTRRPTPEIYMDSAEAKKHLAKLAREADEGTAKELSVMGRVLNEAEGAGVPLGLTVTRTGLMKFTFGDGQPVRVRPAVADGSVKEHEHGLHRFKLSPETTRREYSIFAISHGRELVTYIFKPGELGDLRSLNLRFRDESKYGGLVRKSKYDTARDRWSAMRPRK